MGVRIWGALSVFATMLAIACPASAAEFSISFDDAVINPGGVTQSQTPGINHHNDVWMEPEDVVTLSGTVSDAGSVTVPEAGVVFDRETRTILPFSSYFTIDWSAPGGFTGSFDSDTGELTLSGQIEQTITHRANSCEVGPFAVTLSTENETSAGKGVRFTNGLNGEGTLAGSWYATIAEPSGPDCAPVALHCKAKEDLARKRGAIALSTGPELIPGVPSMSRCERNLRLNEIVYSHDGRITVSAPDGSRRTELTHAGQLLRFPDTDGDDQPSLSPDGTMVAFVEKASPRYPDGSSLMIIDRFSRDALKVAGSDDYSSGYRDPVFDADGTSIYYVRTGEDPAVVRSDLDGNNPENVAAQIPTVRDLEFSDIDLSPNGSELLVGMEGYRDRNGHPIARTYRLDLMTGKPTLLEADASQGAWSPDGKRIVFESRRDRIDFSCFKGYCSASPRLYSMNRNGGDVRRVFPKRGLRSETSPDWSPDGTRITFTSNRSGHDQIHIAKPDGSCLGSLTNGNLASYSASWGSMFESEGGPPTCGNRKLAPRIELKKRPDEKIDGLPRFWLGPAFQGNSIYGPAHFNGHSDLYYGACVRFNYSDCGNPVTIVTYSVCGSYPETYPSYATEFFLGARKYRGGVVEFHGPRKSSRATTVIFLTGGRMVYIEFDGPSPYGNQRPRDWYLGVIDRLRPLWKESVNRRNLPAAALGSNALDRYRKMLGFSKSHTLEETARRFEQSPRSAFFSLKAAKRYSDLGVQPISCEPQTEGERQG